MLVRESSKRASRNASGANTTRDFWAVLQANSARMTTQLQRFPRSAKPAPRNTRGKPPRSPNPWQNRRPFPAEPPRSRGGVPAGKAAGAVTINISLELGRVLGRWNSHPRVQSSVANIMNNEKSPVGGIRGDSDSLRARIHAPMIASFCLLAFPCAASLDRGDAERERKAGRGERSQNPNDGRKARAVAQRTEHG